VLPHQAHSHILGLILHGRHGGRKGLAVRQQLDRRCKLRGGEAVDVRCDPKVTSQSSSDSDPGTADSQQDTRRGCACTRTGCSCAQPAHTVPSSQS
jgi:hypothetical protein